MKVKITKTILICWLWHAVFIFKLGHMRINPIFFIVNFEHVFVSWAQDKGRKTTSVQIKKVGQFL